MQFKSREGCRIRIGCGVPFIIALPLVLLVKWLWPSFIPFGLFQFWGIHGEPAALALDIWPIFVMGLIFQLLNIFLRRPYRDSFFGKPNIDIVGTPSWLILKKKFFAMSRWGLLAGIGEELVFRWIFFYCGIIVWTVLNFCLFGFAGSGIPQWFFLHIAMPIADFATFGKLHSLLFAEYSWVVGAAILSANGRFRRGHAYQGVIGWVWSWYIGMFLFLVMFKYGLFAAMLVHVLYNLMIFTLLWLWHLHLRRHLRQFAETYLLQITSQDGILCPVCGVEQRINLSFANALLQSEQDGLPVQFHCGHEIGYTCDQLLNLWPGCAFILLVGKTIEQGRSAW
jgi:hypothetical protein